MAKTRVSIPKAVEEAVLAEYRHHCAICGSDRPQLHHIDEDPSNNVPLNLLPLCPNCHLRDQHDPAAGIPRGKLQLLRVHKDPSILSAEFHPLYQRIQFLNSIDDPDVSKESLAASAEELVDFVSELNMGAFYSKRLRDWLSSSPVPAITVFYATEEKAQQIDAKLEKEYRQKLSSNRDNVVKLVVELLRYQHWRYVGSDK